MKLFLALFLCLVLTACHTPKASKCHSDKPGIISFQDNFTGQCIEIKTAEIVTVLAQTLPEDRCYTYIMTVDAQGARSPFKAVESYEVVQRKIAAAEGRFK